MRRTHPNPQPARIDVRSSVRSSLPWLWLAVVVVLAGAAVLRAEHTRYWRQSSFDEFERGTAKGIALRSDGKLMLAPRFTSLADVNLAFLWALRADSKGNLYAAGGSGAKVIKIDASGKTTTAFESTELSAQALAMDAQDNLYVGTSPDGKVYKVSPAGEKKAFFDPKTKYIWAIAVDSDGMVYVATGDSGLIYAVNQDGKGDVFYKSDQAHIRALAFDRQGNLLAGTEPDGRILRIAKSAGNGANRQGFVLYETTKKEITSLVVDASGNLYAAAIGDKSRSSGGTFTSPPDSNLQGQNSQLQQTGGQNITIGGAPQQAPPPTNFAPPAASVTGSAVYRLAPDGSPQQIWSSRDTLVYTLGFSASGKLLLGTGNRGVVIQLDGDNLFTNLVKTESGQVTGLTQGPGGKVFLCTANPGKVFTLGPEDVGEGTFESQPLDARFFSAWGRLEWWGENAGASASGHPHVEVFIRTGNTASPDGNWSAWAGPYTQSGQKVEAPPARFAQWKAVLRSGSPSPVISWLSLSFLPKNIAPQVDGIAIQDPGVRIQGIPGTGVSPNPSIPVRLRQPDFPGTGTTGNFSSPAQGDRPGPRFEAPPQGVMQKGFESVLWSAHDDNDDELIYRVYFRGEGEKEWKLLKENLRERYYSWDTSSMADGAYYLKIVASDAPANPSGETLEGDRESDRFMVDNTPPSLEGLEAAAAEASGAARLRFTAHDSASAIARAEFSVDAGDWTLVYPDGRLSDSLEEHYDVALKGLVPGEHTIAVRVYDRFDNVTAGKITFRIPSAGR
jgi:outer membrane protein assembly factor BamB